MKKRIPQRRMASKTTVVQKSAPAAVSEGKKGDRFRVAARWSEKLAAAGFVPIVQDFLDHYHALKPYSLTHSEAMFVVHLMSYKWDDSAPYPGYKSIATKMGISAKSARRYAQSLEQKGYLQRQQRVGVTNRFHLKALIQAVERHAEAARAKAKEPKPRQEPE